jgi:metallo-beta-lactamase family protein
MHAKITFLGATGTVTGSKYLLEALGKKVLIDCGLFQGLKELRLRNWDTFSVNPAEIDAVILTHAHIDHCGYLPRLTRQGFKGPVYCTHATQAFCELLLRDSAHLQEEDARWANKKGFSKHKPALPLYTTQDVESCLQQFTPRHYGEDINLCEGMRLKFRDAGHILGSAFADIKITRGNTVRKILFSGDIGSPNRPILNDPVQVYEVDYLIVESTYGDRLHGDSQSAREHDLARVINDNITRGGILVIPAFAVGRTQELLYHIRELENRGAVPPLPIYIDSPMAINATAITAKMQNDYDLQARMLMLDGQEILKPANLHIARSVEESKALHAVKGPAIFISASGMLEGGRILHHLQERLPKAENTVLFVGYQAEGTRGRALQGGNTEVKIHGQMVPVKAHIETISGFSGHADYREILAWLMGFNRPPKQTFIVHGEPDASRAMGEKIQKQLDWPVTIPKHGQSFELN